MDGILGLGRNELSGLQGLMAAAGHGGLANGGLLGARPLLASPLGGMLGLGGGNSILDQALLANAQLPLGAHSQLPLSGQLPAAIAGLNNMGNRRQGRQQQPRGGLPPHSDVLPLATGNAGSLSGAPVRVSGNPRALQYRQQHGQWPQRGADHASYAQQQELQRMLGPPLPPSHFAPAPQHSGGGMGSLPPSAAAPYIPPAEQGSRGLDLWGHLKTAGSFTLPDPDSFIRWQAAQREQHLKDASAAFNTGNKENPQQVAAAYLTRRSETDMRIERAIRRSAPEEVRVYSARRSFVAADVHDEMVQLRLGIPGAAALWAAVAAAVSTATCVRATHRPLLPPPAAPAVAAAGKGSNQRRVVCAPNAVTGPPTPNGTAHAPAAPASGAALNPTAQRLIVAAVGAATGNSPAAGSRPPGSPAAPEAPAPRAASPSPSGSSGSSSAASSRSPSPSASRSGDGAAEGSADIADSDSETLSQYKEEITIKFPPKRARSLSSSRSRSPSARGRRGSPPAAASKRPRKMRRAAAPAAAAAAEPEPEAEPRPRGGRRGEAPRRRGADPAGGGGGGGERRWGQRQDPAPAAPAAAPAAAAQRDAVAPPVRRGAVQGPPVWTRAPGGRPVRDAGDDDAAPMPQRQSSRSAALGIAAGSAPRGRGPAAAPARGGDDEASAGSSVAPRGSRRHSGRKSRRRRPSPGSVSAEEPEHRPPAPRQGAAAVTGKQRARSPTAGDVPPSKKRRSGGAAGSTEPRRSRMQASPSPGPPVRRSKGERGEKPPKRHHGRSKKS